MKFVKIVIGLLISSFCIGFYFSAYQDFNLYMQGWHGPLTKGIIKTGIGTVILTFGILVIKSAFTSSSKVDQESLSKLNPVLSGALVMSWDPYKNKKVENMNNSFLEYLSTLILLDSNSNKIAQYLTKHSNRSLVLVQDREHDLEIAIQLKKIKY